MPNSLKQRRHPLLVNTPPGVWCPDAVGKVPGYPRTPKAHAARVKTLKANSDKSRAEGRNRRTGVPNGWGGRRDEVAALRQQAADKAWACVGTLYQNSLFEDERLAVDQLEAVRANPDVMLKTDAERWAAAAAIMIEVILSPTYNVALRTEAARALMPYVRAKPARRVTGGRLGEATVFLDALLAGTAPAT